MGRRRRLPGLTGAPASVTIAPVDDRSRALSAARRIFRRAVDPATFIATFFLPRPKRDAVHAIGAFASLTISAVEAATGSGEGRAASDCGGGCGHPGGEGVLDLVRERIEAVFASRLELPLPPFRDETQWALVAAMESARRFEIPQSAMLELVDAVVANASVVRYATWRSLGEHCRQAGGSVARLMTAILGATHSDTGQVAIQIGQAARLTHILDRLRQDAAAGRIALPLEDLARFRCGEKELLALQPSEALLALVRFEVARARELLDAGADGLCWLAGDGSRVAAAVYVTSQRAVLDAMEAAPEKVLLGSNVRVAPRRRLRQLPDAWRLARRRADEPVPRRN